MQKFVSYSYKRRKRRKSYTQPLEFRSNPSIPSTAYSTRKNAQELDKADKLLMIPDYFHYLLTGKPVGISQCDNHTACGSGDKGLELGVNQKA